MAISREFYARSNTVDWQSAVSFVPDLVPVRLVNELGDSPATVKFGDLGVAECAFFDS